MNQRSKAGIARWIDAAATEAWSLAWDGNERSRQTEIGMSQLLSCRRRAWYQVHDVPRTDQPAPGRQAQIGTWIHAGFLDHLSAALGEAEVELEVTLHLHENGAILGHADLWRPNVLLDVKTVGDYAMASVLRDGPRREHVAQTWGYATALKQEGKSVGWVVLLYIHRESGEMHVHVMRYAESDALVREDVVEWVDEVMHDEEPDRDERGPGLSIICDGCPWLKECWGPDAVPSETGPQAQLAVDSEAVVAALDMYDAALQAEKRAKADKQFAAAVLSGTERGKYGGFSLSWTAGSERLDQKQARALLEMHGIDVPLGSKGAPSVRIRRVKP